MKQSVKDSFNCIVYVNQNNVTKAKAIFNAYVQQTGFMLKEKI